MVKYFFMFMCLLLSCFSFASVAQSFADGAGVGFGMLAVLAGFATLVAALYD